MPIRYIPKPIKATITNPVRALDTVYTNNTLRPIMVLVTCWHVVIAPAQACRVNAFVAGGWTSSGGSFVAPGNGTIHSFMSIMVPAGATYEVRTGDFGGNASQLNRWTEVEM